MVLQAFLFGHPRGAQVLLQGLGVERVRFPAEVYNGDEDELSLGENDEVLSEFARGIRYARRKTQAGTAREGRRFGRWLENLEQLPPLLATGSLFVDPLTLAEVPSREAVSERFGISRGEAATISLALRSDSLAVILSSDEAAGRAMEDLELPRLTIAQLLEHWARNHTPSRTLLEELLTGMAGARFALRASERSKLFTWTA